MAYLKLNGFIRAGVDQARFVIYDLSLEAKGLIINKER